MSDLSLEKNQLRITIKEIILDLFSENEENFSEILLTKVLEKVQTKKMQEQLDLEESANLYTEIYQENLELQELTESALLDFRE